MEISLAEGRLTNATIGQYKTRRVCYRLGNPQSVFAYGDGLSKCAHFGKTQSQSCPGEHRGQQGVAQALIEQVAGKRGDRLSEDIHGPLIVTLGGGGHAQVEICHDLCAHVPAIDLKKKIF